MVEIDRDSDGRTVHPGFLARSRRWRRQMLPVDELVRQGRFDAALAALGEVDAIHGYVGELDACRLVLMEIVGRAGGQVRGEDQRRFLTVDDQLGRYGPRRAMDALAAIRYDRTISLLEYGRYERLLEGMMRRRREDLIEREERTIVR